MEIDGNLKAQCSGPYAGCGSSSISPTSWIFVMFVRAVWVLALSCCKRTLFGLTNGGYLPLKISWTRSSFWEQRAALSARPFGINFQWITLQNSTRYTLLWGRTDFLNDDFGTLTKTDSLIRGPFFITCDNSPDKSIIHGIIDKLTTVIHSTLSLLRCQFMRYRPTASLWFSKCLNLAMYGIFWCTEFFWRPTSTFFFCWFCFPKLWYILNIQYLGLPERANS